MVDLEVAELTLGTLRACLLVTWVPLALGVVLAEWLNAPW